MENSNRAVTGPSRALPTMRTNRNRGVRERGEICSGAGDRRIRDAAPGPAPGTGATAAPARGCAQRAGRGAVDRRALPYPGVLRAARAARVGARGSLLHHGAVARGHRGAPQLVLGLFFAESWSIIAAFLAGAVAAAISRRDLTHAATAFAIAQFSFFAALAALTFRAVVGPVIGTELDWNVYLAVYAAAGVLILTSLTTSFAIALHDGQVTRRLAFENVALTFAGTGAAASYGLVAVDLIWSNPRGLFVVVLLGVLLLGGYRALLIERRERRVAEFLRGADEALHHSRELESAIVALIGRAREMFEAQIAQLTIYPSAPGEKAYRTTVRFGDPSGTEVMVPIELTELDDILEADSDGVIIDRTSASPASRDVLSRRHIDHAMVALLRGRTRLVGSLMVGTHVSARSFDQRDLQLFQTLAIQTSSTLENGRLEHSIARLTEMQEQLSHQA